MGNGIVEIEPTTLRGGFVIAFTRYAISQHAFANIDFRLVGIASGIALFLHRRPDKNNVVLGKR